MFATTGKAIQAFWGMSIDELEQKLKEAIKEALPPCYGDGSGDTPDNGSGNSHGSESDSGSASRVSFPLDVYVHPQGCEPQLDPPGCSLLDPDPNCRIKFPPGCPGGEPKPRPFPDLTNYALPAEIPQDLTSAMDLIEAAM